MGGQILVTYGPGTTPDNVELAEQEAIATATKLMLAHQARGGAVGIEVQHHDEKLRQEIHNRLMDARVEIELAMSDFASQVTNGAITDPFATPFYSNFRGKGGTEPIRNDNAPRPPRMNRHARRAAKRAGVR